jgi:hypothetical protein
MRSANELARLQRRHAVTFHDIRSPGEPANNALPATDTGMDFQWPPGCAIRVQTGPKPGKGRKVELHLEFDPASIAPEKLKIYVNSVQCAPKAGSAAPVMVYEVPAEIMADEAQVVEVVGGKARDFSIVRVEVDIAAG